MINLEKELFKRYSANFDKIKKYGFIKKDDFFFYSKNILDDSFAVNVYIDAKDNVDAKIIDLAFEEEYTNYKIEENDGAFVNTIRNEYERILKDIRDKCFDIRYFIYPQSNRITNGLILRHNTYPEFLWSDYEGSGIFRIKENNKWYAAILNVNKQKLGGENIEVEVLDIKLDEKEIEELVKVKGFYRAYHMNKKKWISIILDDTLDDDTILSYIEKSYFLNKGK